MIRELDQFYAQFDEPNRSCLLALRSIVLAQDEAIVETKKYGLPCFCYKGKMYCYLWVEKKSNWPYILMAEGRYLEHPLLEQGDRKRMKIFKVNPEEDLPIETLENILQAGLDVYRNGLVKTK